jgi:hypothetical protein
VFFRSLKNIRFDLIKNIEPLISIIQNHYKWDFVFQLGKDAIQDIWLLSDNNLPNVKIIPETPINYYIGELEHIIKPSILLYLSKEEESNFALLEACNSGSVYTKIESLEKTISLTREEREQSFNEQLNEFKFNNYWDVFESEFLKL